MPGMKTRSRPAALETRFRHVPNGQPLEADTRSNVEPAFGHSFADVRVHADANADSLARALEARAFTVGQDVYFRSGAYQPHTATGRSLLQHELGHTVQAAEGRADAPKRGAGLRVSDPSDDLERETRGEARATGPSAAGGDIVVQRMPEWLAQEQAWEDHNRVPFQGFNQQLSSGLDSLTSSADEGIFRLAQMAQGAPLGLGNIASGAALVGSGAMHVTSGIVGGAGHLFSGLGQMVSTPLSTLGGVERMAENFLPQPLAVLPRALHGAFDFATGDHSLASGMEAMDFAMNPARYFQDQQRMGLQMAGGLTNPIVDHAANGQYGEALGRGFFEALLMLGTGGAGAEATALEETALLGEGVMMERLEPLLIDAELAEFEGLKTVETPALQGEEALMDEALLESPKSPMGIRGSRTPGNWLGEEFDPSLPGELDGAVEVVRPSQGRADYLQDWQRKVRLGANL
jgi:Domain of unknown function (DUF4157)